MATVEQLLRVEASGNISFGNHMLEEKSKVEDFPYNGDLLKVKTYKSITKLEKNGMFMYESVPGTSVFEFKETAEGVEFSVEGNEDAQITVGLEDDTEYTVCVNGQDMGAMKTNLSGKMNLSVELAGAGAVKVSLKK